MTTLSDDSQRADIYALIDAPAASYPLPENLWSTSLEVWINGTLRIPTEDYWMMGHNAIGFAELLLPGDTLRVCGLPAP